MKSMPKPMKIENEPQLRKGEYVLTEGKWNDGTPWKFIVSKEKLNPDLCTAAFCVISHREALLLIQNRRRGWEIPGGHIEEDEKIEQTLIREAMEEAGATIEAPQMFGYAIVLPESPISHRDKKESFYPFPKSYIPYYYAEAKAVLNLKLASDAIEAKLFNFNEAKNILAQGHGHDKIIEYLIMSKLINLS